MAKIISIVEKPIAENVSEEAYFLGIQDNGEGKQALCRMPYGKVCRQLNDLTAEDIQAVKDAALGEVTEAAKNAQEIAENLAERAENGDFNGNDYILTHADKTEIAKQAAELAGAMQGGTVTYKIPKEYYETAFNYASNSINIYSINISFGKMRFNSQQFESDVASGALEVPEDLEHLDTNEQFEFAKKVCDKYLTDVFIPVWVPKFRENWLERIFLYLAFEKGIFETEGTGAAYTVAFDKFWNNDFKVSIHAENSNGEIACSSVKSNVLYSSGGELPPIGMFPYFGYMIDYDEATGCVIVSLILMAISAPWGYGNPLNGYTSYVTDEDVKEVTITFIPNNVVVEEYEDEKTV